MRSINRSLSAAVLAVAVAGGAYAFLGSPMTPIAQAHLRDHPKLQAADEALKDAKEYIEESKSDFHGHKEEALHAIHEARTKISLCADADDRSTADHIRAIPLEERHPRLHEAVKRLREAREYLHEAKADFHGHKEEAIKAVDEAIRHIERLMED
jgi:F0F1-type ATP synthase membrane subunit b/b'